MFNFKIWFSTGHMGGCVLVQAGCHETALLYFKEQYPLCSVLAVCLTLEMPL